MDCAAHFVAAKRRNNALDLPPVTESNDIPGVPAALGAGRGFKAGIIAIALDKVRCVGKRDPAVDEGTVHGRALTRSSVDRLRTSIVNKLLTMLGLAYRQSLGMGAA